MIDPNAPAYPTQNGCKNDPGMTICATMAMHFADTYARHLGVMGMSITPHYAEIAHEACLMTDALIAELNKTEAQS